MPRSPEPADWIALMALTVLWGSAFLLTEIALSAFTPSALVAGRITIASTVLYGYMKLNGMALPAFGVAWLPMATMSVLGNVLPFHLVAWGQQHISSSLAGVLMAAMPLFVVSLAHFFVAGARLTVFRATGFMAGFAGVVFVIGPDALAGLGGNLSLLGAVAVLGAALSYAVNTIIARRIAAVNPVTLAVGMMLFGSLLSLPGALMDISGLAVPTLPAAAALLVLGALSTGFATVLYFRVVQGPGPAFLSFVNYLVPGWAVLAGAAILGEQLSVSVYIGLLLILAGIAISELGPRLGRRARRGRRAAPLARTAGDKA